MIAILARRECLALFRSPLAWAVLAMTQFVLCYQFLSQLEFFVAYQAKFRHMTEPLGVTQVVVAPTFGTMGMLLLFISPVLTMHALSSERRAGTLKFLYSSPVTATQIVLGKFVGLMSLFLVIWGLSALMPLTLCWGAQLDFGTYAAGLLSLWLLMCACVGIGLFCSALTSQPTIAACASFGVLLSLWLIDWASRIGEQSAVLNYVSMLNHFQILARGRFDTGDVAYFLIIIGTSLLLTIWRLNGDRKPL